MYFLYMSDGDLNKKKIIRPNSKPWIPPFGYHEQFIFIWIITLGADRLHEFV